MIIIIHTEETPKTSSPPQSLACISFASLPDWGSGILSREGKGQGFPLPERERGRREAKGLKNANNEL